MGDGAVIPRKISPSKAKAESNANAGVAETASLKTGSVSPRSKKACEAARKEKAATPSPRDLWGYLPAPMMRLLEETGDEELFLRVVARAGGRRMRIPVRVTAGNQLTSVLGEEDARRVQQIFRAAHETWITVPLMTSAVALTRARRLSALVRAGVTVQDAAARCGLTERGAYYALARLRERAASSRRAGLLPDLERRPEVLNALSVLKTS